MRLYRPEDRHPVDNRILVVRDLNDFRLWPQRKTLDFNGIICVDRYDPDELSQAAARIARLAHSPSPSERDAFYLYSSTQSSFQADFPHNSKDPYGIRRKMLRDGFGEPEADIVTELTVLFHVVTSNAENVEQQTLVRVNDRTISSFHTHETTLTFSFQQCGTVCRTGGEFEDGNQYALSPGDIGIIDDTIWHKAPDFSPAWNDAPRVNLVI